MSALVATAHCIYIYIYVCMYVCMCVYIYTYVYVCVYVYVLRSPGQRKGNVGQITQDMGGMSALVTTAYCVYIHICMCVYTYIHMCMCVCMYMFSDPLDNEKEMLGKLLKTWMNECIRSTYRVYMCVCRTMKRKCFSNLEKLLKTWYE